MREALPTGTVTFLFTDIEGSTRLLEALGSAYQSVLERHAALIRQALAAGNGLEVGTEGDSFFAVFRSAPAAVETAAAIQRALAEEPWPDGRGVRVRIGLHTGEGRLGGDSYVGIDVHRAARVSAAGHGGQVLITAPTRALVESALPPSVSLLDLGSHRFKDLDQPEQISQLRIAGLQADFPPLRTLETPVKLPVERSSFVGRVRELVEVGQLLQETRLLTLTGPGGTGKTRLAIQAAARAAATYHDGVYFVDLAPLADPDLVGPTIARSMGLIEQPTRPIVDRLKDHIAGLQVLLVLDNFEHLLPAAAIVSELLATAPHASAMVTSRSVLNLSGERTYAVPPLGRVDGVAPKAGAAPHPARDDAVALFVERATAANPQFSLTGANAEAVLAICRRLDGLPLAIELVASRVRILGPAEILERLRAHRPIPLEGPRDAPERQRTLHAAIDWSYRLLDTPLQRLFTRLSIFEGGCDLEAAEAVCNRGGELAIDTLDGLAGLVDQSLVRRLDEDRGSRYRMLETIREYARDVMAAEGTLREIGDRHLRYYRDLAETAVAQRGFLGAAPASWLDRFEREHDNVRVALDRALETKQAEDGLRLAGAMWRFWGIRGYLREGRSWLQRLLDLQPQTSSPVRGRALSALGGVAYWLADDDATERAYLAALACWREVGDPQGELDALQDLAYVPVMRGDTEESHRRFTEVRDRAQLLDRPDVVEQAESSLGYLVARAGDLDDALGRLEHALAYARSAEDRYQETWALAQLAQVEAWLGRRRESREHVLESLAISTEMGSIVGIGASLYVIASIEAKDHPREALRLLGAASALRARTGAVAPSVYTGADEAERDARQAVGSQASAEAELAAGRAMTLDEAVAYARGLTS